MLLIEIEVNRRSTNNSLKGLNFGIKNFLISTSLSGFNQFLIYLKVFEILLTSS